MDNFLKRATEINLDGYVVKAPRSAFNVKRDFEATGAPEALTNMFMQKKILVFFIRKEDEPDKSCVSYVWGKSRQKPEGYSVCYGSVNDETKKVASEIDHVISDYMNSRSKEREDVSNAETEEAVPENTSTKDVSKPEPGTHDAPAKTEAGRTEVVATNPEGDKAGEDVPEQTDIAADDAEDNPSVSEDDEGEETSDTAESTETADDEPVSGIVSEKVKKEEIITPFVQAAIDAVPKPEAFVPPEDKNECIDKAVEKLQQELVDEETELKTALDKKEKLTEDDKKYILGYAPGFNRIANAYLLNKVKNDVEFAKLVIHPVKTFEKCTKSVFDRAFKLLVPDLSIKDRWGSGQGGFTPIPGVNSTAVDSSVIFEWVEAYYRSDPVPEQEEEYKKACEKAKADAQAEEKKQKKAAARKTSKKKSTRSSKKAAGKAEEKTTFSTAPVINPDAAKETDNKPTSGIVEHHRPAMDIEGGTQMSFDDWLNA